MLSEAFAGVLRSGREHFNREFKSAQRKYPELDGESFGAFLASAVDPLVQATATRRPDSAGEVALAAYDVALELVGQRLAGPRARNDLLDLGWRQLLPPVAELVAQAPFKILSAFSNALHQLAALPPAQARRWVDVMTALGPLAQTPEVLLALGQVCAWRSGLAHYRGSALARADALPPMLALAALGVTQKAPWPTVRDALARSPWFDPNGEAPAIRYVGSVGGFRGLGGPFLEPPRVARHEGQLLVSSAGELWLLTADAFGATLHRAAQEELGGAHFEAALPAGVNAGENCLQVNGVTLPAPLRGPVTSVAAFGTTLAVTCAHSHGVLLLAWQADGR